MKTAIAVLALTLAANSHAGCKELAAAIADSEKAIAGQFSQGIGDDSAPRETTRQLRVSNELAAIQINLVLMERQKCPLPTDPVDTHGTVYLSPALDCARITMSGTPAEAKEACNTSNWKRAKTSPTK
jgi:hypothetical protein